MRTRAKSDSYPSRRGAVPSDVKGGFASPTPMSGQQEGHRAAPLHKGASGPTEALLTTTARCHANGLPQSSELLCCSSAPVFWVCLAASASLRSPLPWRVRRTAKTRRDQIPSKPDKALSRALIRAVLFKISIAGLSLLRLRWVWFLCFCRGPN